MKNLKKQIQDQVSARGGRWTRVREEVLKAFERTRQPMTVAEVFKKIQAQGLDLASVYRTVNFFLQKQILHLEDTVPEGKRYHLSEPYADGHHHHLVCESCGKMEDFYGCYLSKVEALIRRKTGFRVRKHELRFVGLCRSCAR